MLLYGLIAALTAVGVWLRYAQVSDIVSSQATAIAACGATWVVVRNRRATRRAILRQVKRTRTVNR